ncbi:hypothetical protein [Streptomyces sp. NPDC051561]|uniref:hypothetical protein n=1 Tax=Streptomyces sp. NPDC051561 TaxID=3365658 RepID=UPI00378A1888
MKLRSTAGALCTIGLSLVIGVATATSASAASFERDAAKKTTSSPNYSKGDWWFQGGGGNGYGAGEGAFQAAGDKWWVLDDVKDGKSVAVLWTNYRNGKEYRSGVCKNSNKAPSWATCNKNYYEDSVLWAKTCLYDSKTGKYTECNLYSDYFRVSDGKNSDRYGNR